MRWLFACLVGTLFLFHGVGGGGLALAAQPEPWQMGLQPSAGPIMDRVTSLHSLLFWIITIICLVVLALLIYVCVKFKESKHPTPSRRSHNTLLEVVWTAVPVLILVIIAIPSFRLLYFADVLPETELTVKATGKQWYWTYEYPDNGNFTFDAFMLTDDELEPGMLRLLETSERIVLPVATNVRLQVTAADVLHSWAMPSLGVKVDAVPGRLNELWLHIDEPGTYYGQCSELCGVNHGFMPITIEAVTPEAYEAWVAEAQTRFAKVDAEPVHVANR
ncbi:MAG: cytochrome c oxidase subunit II [Geminicoccaceae bacterium]|jgi:cytochrome c oxidase subunit 2|nr:cytochrome c oxidase subunit II [Geminicoccaceae bacterium]